MSFFLGTSSSEKRALLGRPSFGWGPGRADFSVSSIVPPPGADATTMGMFNMTKVETSLQKVAVWACVDLAGSAVEMLPIELFRGFGDSREKLTGLPSWLRDLDGSGQGLPDWCRQAVYSGMLRGNVAAPILERSSRGTPTLLPLAHPDDTSVVRDEKGNVVWRIGGSEWPAEEVWHKRVNPVPGMMLGLSPIAMHILTVGTALQAEQFGFSWFRDGAHPSALLTTDGNLNPDQANEAKKRFVANLRGREPAVLGNGWKYQPIQIAPNESQFLETMEYTGAECCRIFGPGFAEILGYKTGGSLTYTTREDRQLDLLTYALNKWLTRLERWLSDLLPAPQNVRFNRAALLETDLLSRFKAHNIAIASGFMTDDEVRAIEDLPPLTEGQRAVMAASKPALQAAPFDQSGAKP